VDFLEGSYVQEYYSEEQCMERLKESIIQKSKVKLDKSISRSKAKK